MEQFPRPRRPLPDAHVHAEAEVREFLDPWHPRASVETGHPERVLVDPERVLDNITLALHRFDVDVDAPPAFEPDTVTVDELAVMLDDLDRAAALVARLVNIAVQLMTARYPEPLVRFPLPDTYDLRAVDRLAIGDRAHDLARDILNQRLAADADLHPDELVEQLRPLSPGEQVHLLVALCRMYRHKLLALKHHTGTY
ncbi:hypothetical protein [Saccharothrix texasensis]|uniref:Uncharacterized protein n=1 Tax=Saccharothrix texasensis TaxID=103734 RepID=A0A3N1HGV5_9PSEU|nr:hypothetical protein [Saccharothrix texasensis]ROP41743.1 hypothetical protein EDD40_7180 [Saccharothrix texasensis]